MIHNKLHNLISNMLLQQLLRYQMLQALLKSTCPSGMRTQGHLALGMRLLDVFEVRRHQQ